MRGITLALLALVAGCASEPDTIVNVIVGESEPLSDGGDPGAGGVLESGGTSPGGAVSFGGSAGESTGGAPQSGGAMNSSGGATSGGSPAVGGSTGGQGTGGTVEPPEPDILWSWRYSGFNHLSAGTEYLSARIWLNGDSCPISIGHLFTPETLGTFEPTSTYSLDCANAELLPLAQFGHEWPADSLPNIDYSDPDIRIRFTLNSITASEWPTVSGSDVDVDFLWEIVRVQT